MRRVWFLILFVMCACACGWACCCVVVAQGFDEYMNLVLDDASEVDMKQKSRKSLGRVMLKGDNITAIFKVPQA